MVIFHSYVKLPEGSYSFRFQAHAPEPQTPLAFTCVSKAPPGRLRSVAVAVEVPQQLRSEAAGEERKVKGEGGSNSDKILRP